MNEPRWDGRRWRIQARKDGKRYSFSSSTPGAKGRREVKLKYERWFYDESTGEKSVGKVIEEYLEDVKARCGEHSAAHEQYECYIRLYIAPVCAQRKMNRMTLRDWQAVINGATGEKKALSEKTLKNLRAIINAIVKFGYEDFQCEPLRGSLYIPKGHSKQEKEVLDRDDVRRLLEPSKLWYHPAFCLGVLTGLRPGEILGLQVDDIKKDRVYIKRAVNARGHITEGKNENARRMVPIGELAGSIIRQTIKRNDDANLDTKWIFCSPDGSQGKQNGMRKHWAKLKEERNLPGTVYSLRHTFITLMKNVMPESMIKDIVGHSTSMDTFGTYGHILSGDAKKAAEIIDLLGASLGADSSASGGRTAK